MTEPTTSTHDATVKLLHALVEEIRSVAHDPALVHAIAEKLKHGIDMLADAIAQSKKAEEQVDWSRGPTGKVGPS